MVPFAFSRTRRWNRFEEPTHLLVGCICLPLEHQHWHFDPPELFCRQRRCDRTPNDGRQHFRVGSRDTSCNKMRGAKVPVHDFSLLQNPRSLLRPHPKCQRARPRIGNRPVLRKLQNCVFDGVVPDPSENCRLT
jgi:hypothetical protein